MKIINVHSYSSKKLINQLVDPIGTNQVNAQLFETIMRLLPNLID